MRLAAMVAVIIATEGTLMIRFARNLCATLALMPMLAWAGPVDLNTADAETLARELKGIGPARAEAIIAWREANGPFRAPEDIVLVQGIGERVLEDNRDNIIVSAPEKPE
jgi:competence protein ComEA